MGRVAGRESDWDTLFWMPQVNTSMRACMYAYMSPNIGNVGDGDGVYAVLNEKYGSFLSICMLRKIWVIMPLTL